LWFDGISDYDRCSSGLEVKPEGALFAAPGETYEAAGALRIVHVERDCRRHPATELQSGAS
jgi:hypothetical protein